MLCAKVSKVFYKVQPDELRKATLFSMMFPQTCGCVDVAVEIIYYKVRLFLSLLGALTTGHQRPKLGHL